MLDPITIGMGALQGFSALSGILGGNAAAKRAEAARQMAINQLASSYDQQYQDQLLHNQMGLMSAAGKGGDAVSQLYSRALSDHSAAGINNSTADTGYHTLLLSDQASNLAGLASDMNWQANQMKSQGNQAVANL